jgi:lysyl-tRNA synthetase, class I
MTEVKHWSEVIAEQVVMDRKEPYVVASAITTSGPVHMGTVCEFLYPSALVKYLEDKGHKTQFYFIGDIFDAFDKIPTPLAEHKFLNDYLGRPLCNVPDPFGCCNSYGDHFLNEAHQIMERLEVAPNILKSNEMYQEGLYDEYLHLYVSHLSEVRRLLEEVSGRDLPMEWLDVALPICENCGRISTTTVKSFEEDSIRYVDDKVLKYTRGCGHEGEMKISDHKYKLLWRLDWPTRQTFLHVSAEGAGVDHHTRGGSWDTAVRVHREILGHEPPVGYKYGFVLLRGEKYSKSKGIGLGIKDLLDLVPPELIKYSLFKPNIEENKDFNPSGYKLIQTYDDYNKTAGLFESGNDLSRAENKMILAYELSTRKRRWRADFMDILLNYQLYKDWKTVGLRVGDPEGVEYLKVYVENWINLGYVPQEFVFKFSPKKITQFNQEISVFADRLNSNMTDENIHNLVYEVARERGIPTSTFFKAMYSTLIDKDSGPKLGRLISAVGTDRIKEELKNLYQQ